MRVIKLQIARRLVQMTALALLLAIPAVSRYGNYLAARELDQNIRKWDGTVQGRALKAMDATFRSLPKGEKERAGEKVRDRKAVLSYTQSLRGGPWSVQLAGLSMTDPLAGAESVVAGKKVARVLVISLIVPVLLTLVLGRVFCSWVCPMNLFLEITDRLRGVLKLLELPPLDIKFSRTTKYALLFTGLVLACIFATPVFGYIYPPAIISREAHDLVFGIFDGAEDGHFNAWMSGLTWMSLLILAIALFEVTLSRRWWCRYICPGGALYGLIGVARPARVVLKKEKCTRCAACVVVCPVGLNPMINRMGMDCDNCGLCISHCNDDALAYRLGRAKQRETVAGETSTGRSAS